MKFLKKNTCLIQKQTIESDASLEDYASILETLSAS
jgi:hypothetical protein